MKYNSGDKAPKTGAYRVVNSKGETVNTVHMKKDDKLPPTQSSREHYEID